LLTDLVVKGLISAQKLILGQKLLIDPFDPERMGPVSYDIKTHRQGGDEESIYLVSDEEFNLPRSIAALVLLRSNTSFRKSPLLASFSQLVDPGYSGHLVFRLLKLEYPFGDLTNLFQIIFFEVKGEVGEAYNERQKSTAMGRKGF